MIHRSTIGSLERTFAFLIEHYAGAFPMWLAPVQVAVLPISEKYTDYANTVMEKLRAEGIRAELHAEDESLGKRIRQQEKQKVPTMLILGENEQHAGNVTVRQRKDIDIFGTEPISLEEFLTKISKEIF
jgi:threonyl-tRNA synthetase